MFELCKIQCHFKGQMTVLINNKKLKIYEIDSTATQFILT